MPDVQTAFGLVHRAADILENSKPQNGQGVRREYQSLLKGMGRRAKGHGPLQRVLRHFLKVTDSYWAGPFHCYDIPDLPRTHNALEQLFGSARCDERRCTGRKCASPTMVLRGSVRIVAAVSTRNRCFQGKELAPKDTATWYRLRSSLDRRRQARTLRRRFRRDPEGYLRQLEAIPLKRVLPP